MATQTKKHQFYYVQNGKTYTVKGIANDHGSASDMDIEEVLNSAGNDILSDLEAFDVLDDIQCEADREAVALFPEPTEEEIENYYAGRIAY